MNLTAYGALVMVVGLSVLCGMVHRDMARAGYLRTGKRGLWQAESHIILSSGSVERCYAAWPLIAARYYVGGDRERWAQRQRDHAKIVAGAAVGDPVVRRRIAALGYESW